MTTSSKPLEECLVSPVSPTIEVGCLNGVPPQNGLTLLTSWKLQHAVERLGLFEHTGNKVPSYSLRWYQDSRNPGSPLRTLPSRTKADSYSEGFIDGWEQA